jgi:hypothetical protein
MIVTDVLQPVSHHDQATVAGMCSVKPMLSRLVSLSTQLALLSH